MFSKKPLVQQRWKHHLQCAGESPLGAGGKCQRSANECSLIAKKKIQSGRFAGARQRTHLWLMISRQNWTSSTTGFAESLPEAHWKLGDDQPAGAICSNKGVINIVTKKRCGRKEWSDNGTHRYPGDAGIAANYNLQKAWFCQNINGGGTYNPAKAISHSAQYMVDPANFNTISNFRNKRLRPRANVDYDLLLTPWMLWFSTREWISATGSLAGIQKHQSFWPIINGYNRTYCHRWKRIIQTFLYLYMEKKETTGRKCCGWSPVLIFPERKWPIFYQQYFLSDYTPTGLDSTQQQLTGNTGQVHSTGSVKMCRKNKKTSFSPVYSVTRCRNEYQLQTAQW